VRAPWSSLTLLIWGACLNPSRVRLELLISRAIVGWQLGAPVFVTFAGFVGSRPSRPSSC
jgi:hypothetical protein